MGWKAQAGHLVRSTRPLKGGRDGAFEHFWARRRSAFLPGSFLHQRRRGEAAGAFSIISTKPRDDCCCSALPQTLRRRLVLQWGGMGLDEAQH